jgi:hypothetical protein
LNCDYCGNFAAGVFELGQNNSIISLLDAANPSESAWKKKYSGKKVKVTSGSVFFIATVKETCSDSDSNYLKWY